MLPALSGSSARRDFGSRRWYHGICREKCIVLLDGLGDPLSLPKRFLSFSVGFFPDGTLIGHIRRNRRANNREGVAYVERRIKFGLGLPRASSDFRPRSHGRWCLPRCQPPDYILLILHRVYVPMWFLLLLFPPPLPLPSPCRI